jgi:hypothetical protein
MKRRLFVMSKLLLSALLLLTFSTACNAGETDMFSIYTPKNIIYSHKISKDELQKIKLNNKPIITIDDIIVYYKSTHEIELTSSAYKRIMQLRAGTPFVVCVGDERIYAGNIWNLLRSSINGGIVICKPLKPENNIIRLQAGYPTSHYFIGEDPRSDPRIIRALEISGKMRENR